MISFRQLIVTIVSIFLALGLGILAGTTIIDQSLVKTLRQQTAQAEQTTATQGKQLHEATALLTGLVPFVVHAKLAHRRVVVVVDGNADGGAVSEVTTRLQEAKAEIVAQLETTSSLDPGSPSQSTLTKILTQDGAASSGDPSVAAGRALADRLAAGPPALDPKTGNPIGHDLLGDLLSAGFLDFPHTSPPSPRDVGGAGQMVVVVTGGRQAPAVPYDAFMLPFVQELSASAVPVGVAEPRATSTSRSFVEVVRDDTALGASDVVATVDDLSSADPRGGLALILALRDLVRPTPRGGNYGVKRGASGLLPPAP